MHIEDSRDNQVSSDGKPEAGFGSNVAGLVVETKPYHSDSHELIAADGLLSAA